MKTDPPHESGLLGAGFWKRLASHLHRPRRPANGLEPIGDGLGYTIAPDVQVSAHDDGLALLHIRTGRVFLCNQMGAQVWRGIEEGLHPAAICDRISSQNCVALDLVHRHVAAFLLDIERHGLMVRNGTGL